MLKWILRSQRGRAGFLTPVSVLRAGPSLEVPSLFNPDSWFRISRSPEVTPPDLSGGFYAHPHTAGISSDTKSRSLRAGNNYTLLLNHRQHCYLHPPAAPGTKN